MRRTINFSYGGQVELPGRFQSALPSRKEANRDGCAVVDSQGLLANPRRTTVRSQADLVSTRGAQ